jgi:hypothetical protein
MHLGRKQIINVYELYHKTYNLKKKIGTEVVGKTDLMISDSTKSINLNQMIGVLSEIYTICTLPERHHGLIDKLCGFLHACRKANHRIALGLSRDLTHEQESYIQSLIVYFNFVLLKKFRNFWLRLLSMENDDKVLSSVSLKSLVALIEYDIRVQRRKELGDENSDYQRLLFENTCLKPLFTEIKDDELFSHMDSTNAVLYPRHAEASVIHNVRSPFKKIFMEVFEGVCYAWYARFVALMQITNKEVDELHGDLNLDNDDDDWEIFESRIGMSYEQKNNILRPMLLGTFYYLTGAAFNSCISIFNADQCDLENKIQTCILKNLTISLMEAKKMNLPCDRTDSKAVIRNGENNEIRLICVGKELFECIITIEEEVIMPIFEDIRFLCQVGCSLYQYLYSQLRCSDAFSALEELFANAISSIDIEGEEMLIYMEDTITAIMNKFLEYYLGARFNDYTQVLIPKLNKKLKGRNSGATKSISFRTGIKLGLKEVKKKDI